MNGLVEALDNIFFNSPSCSSSESISQRSYKDAVLWGKTENGDKNISKLSPANMSDLDTKKGGDDKEEADDNIEKEVLFARILELFSKTTRKSLHTSTVKEILLSGNKEAIDLLAVLAFYFRSIKKGQGERKIFYSIILLLWEYRYQNLVYSLIPLIPKYGYWKDIYNLVLEAEEKFKNNVYDLDYDKLSSFLVNFHIENFKTSVSNIQKRQMQKSERKSGDEEVKEEKEDEKDEDKNKKIGDSDKERFEVHNRVVDIGVGKYMPREHSKGSDIYSKAMFPHIKNKSIRYKLYRKELAIHSSYFKTIETKLCSKNFDSINWKETPSVAMTRYRDTFLNVKKYKDPFNEEVKEKIRSNEESRINLSNRYSDYLQDVKNGKGKINSDNIQLTDFPGKFYRDPYNETIELQFSQYLKNLENNSTLGNCLSIVDVSGSMKCPAGGTKVQCIDMAVLMGIAVSKLSSSPWKDRLITFSTNPSWVNISQCKSYKESFTQVYESQWSMSTDFRAVFNLILSTALENEVPDSDMPKMLFVFSDMQFNEADYKYKSSYEDIQDKYKQSGYTLPRIVFWNLRSSKGYPVDSNTPNTFMMSGFSLALLKYFLNGDIDKLLKSCNSTPFDLMMEILNGDNFSDVWKAIKESY